jgi:quinol monooxygenase YgiN
MRKTKAIFQHKKIKQILFHLIIVVMTMVSGNVMAQQDKWLIRIAKIEVDSALLTEYKTAVEMNIRTSVQSEPGVLTMYAVYEKLHPNRVTVFEIYANEDAYKSHLQTAHFLAYKGKTLPMVKSLELIDVNPIIMSGKPGVEYKQ